MSFWESTIQRAGMLFAVAPAIALWWFPYNGLEVRSYWLGVWLAAPFAVSGLLYGWMVRMYFNARQFRNLRIEKPVNNVDIFIIRSPIPGQAEVFIKTITGHEFVYAIPEPELWQALKKITDCLILKRTNQ